MTLKAYLIKYHYGIFCGILTGLSINMTWNLIQPFLGVYIWTVPNIEAWRAYGSGAMTGAVTAFGWLMAAWFFKLALKESHESTVDEIKRYRSEYAEQGNEEAKP